MRRLAITTITMAAVVLAAEGLAAQAAPPTTPPTVTGNPPAAAGRPLRQSWTSDRLPINVGDIVTILVDEFTLTEANRDNSSSRDRDRNVGVSVNGAGTRTGGSLGSQNDISNSEQGGASRSDRFSAEISVRVVELGPNGLARLEGTKKMQIDEHEQEVVVRGWVRTGDVRAGNMVESWRLADAELLYTSNGQIVKGGGIWDMLFKWIIP